MTPAEQKRAAKYFVARWESLPCVEEEHSRSFWIELLQDVLGVQNATHALEFERKVKGRKIDVFYEDMGILIEMKGRDISLDEATVRSKKAGPETPYQQAKWYADNLPNSIRPRWIITCNFDEFRIYDMEAADDQYVSLALEELPEQVHLLSFFSDRRNSRLVKEKELSVKAGELVGKLYAQLSQQYRNIETDAHEQRSLNVLIVRLVFLLYAEDSGLLHEKDALLNYLKRFPADQMRQAVIDLFAVLDTPADARDPYLPEYLLAFPYVNGGLFGDDDIVVPQFTDQIRLDLLLEASQSFDWSHISPTIFGAAFESTLNPATRRAGGMHYTSIENIHKVIDPLFLDDLRAELSAIESDGVERNRKVRLRAFQRKLASINVFDPACGSGNFLTESYLSLRKLENRVLEDLQGDQMSIGFDGESSPIQVSIDQFFGIEINDFAVSVAKTALWIAEEQMMEATQEILLQPFDFLPLKSNDNIHEGNALRMDWNDVLPAEKCTYICGNPPFIGSSLRTSEQTADMGVIAFSGLKKWAKVDYCGAWYHMAARYINESSNTRLSFVSTNSICQGEQVEPMWSSLFAGGLSIDYAWKTFVWNSEASEQAHVHCVIVGLSHGGNGQPILLDGESRKNVDHINGYLSPAPDVFIPARSRAIDSLHKPVIQGCKPVDGGNLVIKKEEYESFCSRNPALVPYVRPYIGADEFINGKERYCLWLKNADLKALDCDDLRVRLDAVRFMRMSSPTEEFRKYADKPHLFVQDRQPDDDYLVFPSHTSERRAYVPIGYLNKESIVSNAVYVIPGASLFDFGLVSSAFHNAWVHVVAGRIKSDYRYTPVVYNSYPYPNATNQQQSAIEQAAKLILSVRSSYEGKSLAELYDPDRMPADLLAAHKALDATVEEAYGVNFNGDEERIVTHLFKLYAQLTEKVD